MLYVVFFTNLSKSIKLPGAEINAQAAGFSGNRGTFIVPPEFATLVGTYSGNYDTVVSVETDHGPQSMHSVAFTLEHVAG